MDTNRRSKYAAYIHGQAHSKEAIQSPNYECKKIKMMLDMSNFDICKGLEINSNAS